MVAAIAASCNSDEVSDKTMRGIERAPECGQQKLEWKGTLVNRGIGEKDQKRKEDL